ncbi:MAG: hypothetical protein AB7N76_32245 [Planctomycetota bacterium]
MPWHCCDLEHDDLLMACPSCGKPKRDWTIRFDATRSFVVGAAKTVALLRLWRGGAPRAVDARYEVRDAGGTMVGEGRCNVVAGQCEVALGRKALKQVKKEGAQLFVYFLNHDLQDDGEALLLHLGKEEVLEDAPGATRGLRALGLWGRQPLEADPTPDERVALDVALAAFQQEHAVQALDPYAAQGPALQALEARYHDYAWEPRRLPSLSFPEPAGTKAVVLRLACFRGEGPRALHAHAVVLDQNGGTIVETRPLHATPEGLLEVPVPAERAADAVEVRLFLRDDEGREVKDGVVLHLGARADLSKPQAASRALAALGLFGRAPLANDAPDADQQLELELAGAAFQRTAGPTAPVELLAAAAKTLERGYWGYQPAPRALASLRFPEPPDTSAAVVQLQLFRGAGPRELAVRAVVLDAGGAILLETRRVATGGLLELRVPAETAAQAAKARVYVQEEDGREREGFVLHLGAKADLSKAQATSRALAALGLWTRAPLESDAPDADAKLGLELAGAAFQRAAGPAAAVELLAAAAKTLARGYWAYQLAPRALESLRFPEPPDTSAVAVRLQMFRGAGPREVGVRAVVLDEAGAVLLEVKRVTQGGVLEVPVPAASAAQAKRVRLYIQDAAGVEREGLVLHLGPRPDLAQAQGASRALAGLGLWERAPLDGGQDAQDRLTLDLAVAALQRAAGHGAAVEPLPAAQQTLSRAYWGYQPRTRQL